MEAMTAGTITIEGLDGIASVRRINIENIPSMHPTAYIECGLTENIDITHLQFEENIVQIIGESKIIFSGLIQNIQIEEKNPQVYIARLWLIARSREMDLVPQYRSFQEVSMKYGEIIANVARETKGVYVQNDIKEDTSIGMPLIQYNETNWEYIKRLASKFHKPIIVDETSTIAGLMIGKIDRVMQVEFISGYHRQGYGKEYYDKNLGAYDIPRAYTQYHIVRSYGNYPVGYKVSYCNQEYYICKKKAFFDKELLIWEYVLAHEPYLFVPRIYNEKLVGCTILGDVVSTCKETVKLRLHLKDEKDAGIYYDYNWVPETGNLMYCMPMAGTVVSLYFPDSDETAAMAVNSIRQSKGGEADYEPSVKSLLTEEGDALVMADESIHLLTQKEEQVTNQLTLLDDDSMLLRSVKRISIHSETGIAISGAAVWITAKTNIGFDQGRCDENDQSFNFFGFYAGVFHMVGQDALRIIMAGRYKDKGFGIILDVPEIAKKQFTKGMILNLVLGVATVAAVAALCVFALPAVLTGLGLATAGTAATIAAGAAGGAVVTGLFAVGEKTIEDYNRGEATDFWDYMGNITIKTIGGAIEGGICALAGPVTWAGSKAKIGKKIATKLLCDQAGNAVSTITDNLIDGDEWNKELGLSSVTTLVTGGVFDILPGAPFVKKASGKVKSVSDKISDKFMKSSTMQKVKKLFGNLAESTKLDSLYKKVSGKIDSWMKYGNGQKDYINHINNSRDSVNKMKDLLHTTNSGKEELVSKMKNASDEIKQLNCQISKGGDVDDLIQQLANLKKQLRKFELDISSKTNAAKNISRKLKESDKLINKVLKQEGTKNISLAVSKKMWRVLYIDSLQELQGKLKSEGIKKGLETVNELLD